MRSRLSVLLLGFLVILAVVVGLALYLLNDEDFLKAKLGEFVRQQTGRDLVLWDGSCEVHEVFSAIRLEEMREEHPDAVVAEVGADALRLYEMFMGPLEATKPWSTSSIAGVRRFLDRVYTVTTRADASAKPDAALTRLLHQTIRKVTDDIEAMRFNTAISAMITLSSPCPSTASMISAIRMAGKLSWNSTSRMMTVSTRPPK